MRAHDEARAALDQLEVSLRAMELAPLIGEHETPTLFGMTRLHVETLRRLVDHHEAVEAPRNEARATAEALLDAGVLAPARTCSKCDQEVVRERLFWVLTSELGSGRATFCPAGGIHEVDDDGE